MPRRVTLPGAAELFRPTQSPQAAPLADAPIEAARIEPAPTGPASGQPAPSRSGPIAPDSPDGGRTRGSGRVRHDEKITVYVSSDELLALERARLVLRAEHAMAVDRGRIVREALALALEDFDADGGDSELVRRLSSS